MTARQTIAPAPIDACGSSTESSIRAASARAFWSMATRDAPGSREAAATGRGALRVALDDPSVEVAMLAAQALELLGEPRESLAPIWRAALGAPGPHIHARLLAARGLVGLEPPSRLLPFFIDWLREARFRWWAINNAWNQWVLGFNPERQLELLTRLGMDSPDWRKMTAALALLWSITGVTLITLLLIRRPLILECLDPGFLRQVSGLGAIAHYGFLALLVINLVAGFHALGTLMAVGIMVLPAASARFWARRVGSLVLVATGIALFCSVSGLLISYHADWPTSPVIVLGLGVAYLLSMAFAPRGVLRQRITSSRHLQA